MFGSGGGFFGIENTGFGKFLSSGFNTIENAVNKGAEFVSRLPNDLISAGNDLGNTIYGGGQMQDKFVEQGREFYSGRTGQNAGQFINNNFNLIAFTAAIIALITVLGKK